MYIYTYICIYIYIYRMAFIGINVGPYWPEQRSKLFAEPSCQLADVAILSPGLEHGGKDRACFGQSCFSEMGGGDSGLYSNRVSSPGDYP